MLLTMLLSLVLAGCQFIFLTPSNTCSHVNTVEATAELKLTSGDNVGGVQLPGEVRSAPEPYLEVSISRINNPESVPFAIFVSLEWCTQQGPQKILLGNFTPYPPQQIGSFTLRTSNGLEKLKELGADLKTDPIILLLELRRLPTKATSASVQVTIAPVRWRKNLQNDKRD